VVVLQKGFNLKKESIAFESELAKRFGVSNNKDEKIYDIKLEFSEASGNYISKMSWHKSQKIIRLANKNYQITMS
jgi:hypothetical protein